MLILIVEDSPLELRRIERFVREWATNGSEIHAFSESKKALAFVTDGRVPDIAILDIEMSPPSGMELAQKLITVNPRLNVVFCTAYASYMPEAFAMFASGYLLKPFTAAEVHRQLDNLRYPITRQSYGFHAKTFGEFDFFYNNKPITFSYTRSKELLAYLIDRRGASVTKREIFSILFEDQEYTLSRQDYLKKIILALKCTLAKYGGEDILVHSHNSYAVDTSRFSCDLYDWLNSKDVRPRFDYMEQYSWAEGQLSDISTPEQR